MLLEDIGLWIPPTVYHIEHDDKPENEQEGYFLYNVYVASVVDFALWSQMVTILCNNFSIAPRDIWIMVLDCC